MARGLDRPGKREAPGDFRVPHRAIALCRIDWCSVEIRSQGVHSLSCGDSILTDLAVIDVRDAG
jgi:hypothetical protein